MKLSCLGADRHTRLDSAGSAVVGTGHALLSLVEGGLLGVRSNLLLHLVAEALASFVC